MLTNFRKKLIWLHTWTGLTIGIAMVLLAVTGGIVVLREQLGGVVDRDLLSVPACRAPLPYDTLVDRARAAKPGVPLRAMEYVPDPTASAAIMFQDKDYVYLDPCTGRVLGVRNEYGGFFGVADWLHRFHFMEGGRQTAGVLNTAILLLIVVAGVVLWWPKSGSSFRAALTFNWRLPGIVRTLNLHKVLGAYAAALLFLLTLTALPLSFGWAKSLLAVMAGSPVSSPATPTAPVHMGAPRLSLEALWSAEKAAFPDADWASLNFKGAGNSVARFEILEPGVPHRNAKSYLYLDAVTGQQLSLLHYATDIPPGRKAYLYVLALHSGLVWGLPFQLLLFLACAAVPVQFYSGLSPYLRKRARKSANDLLTLDLVARHVEALGICSFEFADPKGRPLPAFSAGSHIDVHIAPGLTRQYSLCNDPAETHRYVIAVQRDPQSRGGSQAMHDDLEVGGRVKVSRPKNHFPLAHGAKRSLLIAGGIGITPLLCMAERLANIGADFDLHYSVRSLEHAAFQGRISASSFASRSHRHVSATGGRLDIEALLVGEDRDSHIYVCGPQALIDAVVDCAHALGWPDARVHREYFAAVTHDAAANRPFEVRIASTGEVLDVPADRSVVDVLAEHGIDIPTSCSEGVCGTCLTRVLEGDVDHRDVVLSPEDHARGDQFTPCCSRARGQRLVLDL